MKKAIPGWAQELKGENKQLLIGYINDLPLEEFGISSFIFRSDRPFHPARMLFASEYRSTKSSLHWSKSEGE